MKKYHCIHCGRELRPMLIWNCPDDSAVLVSGQVLHIDHAHEPDTPYDATQQAEPVILTEWRITPSAPEVVVNPNTPKGADTLYFRDPNMERKRRLREEHEKP